MKGRNTRRGFTLIELLVVVLIIGILAAVALPQYNKAVRKAQGTEALQNLNAIRKAQVVYFLENGQYTTDLSQLALEIQPGYYQYTCRNGSDCYAIPQDSSAPQFERNTQYLWCRGTENQCKPFSTRKDTRFGSNSDYWLMETF